MKSSRKGQGIFQSERPAEIRCNGKRPESATATNEVMASREERDERGSITSGIYLPDYAQTKSCWPISLSWRYNGDLAPLSADAEGRSPFVGTEQVFCRTV